MTLIDSIGGFGIEIDDSDGGTGQYTIVELDGAGVKVVDGIEKTLSDNSIPVTGDIAGYVPIHVESDGAGGYTVLWENASDPLNKLYVTWTVTSEGAKNGPAVAVDDVETVELFYGADIDGDSNIGPAVTIIEENGLVDVITSNGTYVLLSGGTEITLTDNNVPVTDTTYATWSVQQAESNGDGTFKVLWQNSSTGAYITWTVDENGAKVGPAAAVSNVESFESFFGFDIDGDGVIESPLSVVEAVGNVTVLTSEGAYLLSPDDGTPVALTDGGVAVTDTTYATWTVQHAESNPDGSYTVLWKNSATNAYITWAVDANGAKDGAATSVPDVIAVEAFFQADINEDTFVGPPTSSNIDVETNGDVTVVTNEGAYLLVFGGQEIALTDNNVAATDTRYGDWTVQQAEENLDGTFQVLWQNGVTGAYITWTVDATGAKTGSATSVPDVIAVEEFFQADINEDTFVGTPPTTNVNVETNGDVAVVTNEGAYLLVFGGQEIALTDGGVAVTDTRFANWTVQQAEENPDGTFQVLWQNSATNAYLSWTVNAEGAKTGSATPVADVVAVEEFYQVDIDGDLNIGPVVPVNVDVETNGDVAVVTNEGAYLLVFGGQEIALTDGGLAVTDTSIPNWTVQQAEENPDGSFTVLWKNGITDAYVTWSVTSLGAKTGPAQAVSNVGALETFFQADLDGSGSIGSSTVLVEANGAVTVETDAGAYVLVPDLGSPVALTDGGVPVTDTTFAVWTVQQAEADGEGGYTVLWKNSDTSKYITWNVDSTGAKDGPAQAVSDIVSLEEFFGADLNGDNGIGPNVSIENNGAVEVATANGAYILVLADGTEVVLTENASLVTPTSIPGWTIQQAEADGEGGYTVLWQNSDTAAYVTWSVDASGAKVGPASSVSNVVELEPFFDADIDGDGFQFVEGNGSVVLQTNALGEYSVDNGVDPAIAVTDGAAATVSDASLATATMTQAEELDLGGYLLMLDDGSSFGTTWTLDAAGQKTGETTLVTIEELQDLEETFGFDLDGNGVIDPVTPIEPV